MTAHEGQALERGHRVDGRSSGHTILCLAYAGLDGCGQLLEGLVGGLGGLQSRLINLSAVLKVLLEVLSTHDEDVAML